MKQLEEIGMVEAVAIVSGNNEEDTRKVYRLVEMHPFVNAYELSTTVQFYVEKGDKK